MPDIPIKIIGHENESLTYTNAIVLYDEGGSIILNFCLIDRLSEVVQDLFENDDKDKENTVQEVSSVGRFVISYSTAYDLLRNLEEILQESQEEDNEDSN
ncbi:hypothetical protein PCC8801_0667 [Rippkaea orientalis PCC 8801]|uniref:Uncharacterized protein n=1 Tax=Rippkaea orientalis (strain PCC 8801 / RF-1) TaxID=41431 RepID=B7JXJ5_RIPO1|nr:hypothetical protein [Rippkaea orientalis]ACK64752.1 hypothetical protein PCC8801_0667 [Rippkaea orientalis PCC 8801]